MGTRKRGEVAGKIALDHDAANQAFRFFSGASLDRHCECQLEQCSLRGAIMFDANSPGLSDNAAGAVAYFTFVPAVVLLLLPSYNTNSYVRFHAWQSILLSATVIGVSLLLSLAVVLFVVFGAFFLIAIARLIWFLWLALWLVCVLKALNGQRFKVPIIGNMAEKQARG
jgi:uncharacterized membrane protein